MYISFVFVLFWKEGIHTMERSSEEKTLGGLTHIAAIVGWIGVVANVVLFVIYREKSQYVAGHAKQALGLSVLSVVVSWVLGLFGAGSTGLLAIGSVGAAVGAAMIVGLISLAWGIVVLVFAIMAALKGFKGEEHRYPLFGEFVAKIGS